MEIPVMAVVDSIKRGDILLSEFDDIDHRKFFVIMGVSEDMICGFFKEITEGRRFKKV